MQILTRSVTRDIVALLALLLLSAGFFTACADDDPVDPEPESKITQPKATSEFIFTEYETENGVKIDDTELTMTQTVLETGVEFQGKSNVRKDEERRPGQGQGKGRDTVYVAYESNDDLSLWLDLADDEDPNNPLNAGAARWITVPFGSKTDQSYTLLSNDTVNATLTTSYLRDEKAIINGEERDAWVGQLRLVATVTTGGQTLTINSTSILSLLPSIGSLFRSEVTTTGFLGTSGEVKQLTSFTLVQ